MNTVIFDFWVTGVSETEARRRAKNFRRFLDRREPGLAYQRDTRVIWRPGTARKARTYIAQFGYIADITLAPIEVVPQ